jgi:tetratricopeptide (TPR) repeat protein
VTRQRWTPAIPEDETELLVGDPPAPGPPDVRPSVGTANVRPFVGRSAELAQLTSALEAARSGHGSLILISGEPGIGKSRLIDELADVARQRGCRVLIGRCWDGGGAPAYWPWVQIVRAGGGEFDELASFAHGPSGRSSAEMVTPDEARFQLFDRVAGFLSQRTKAAPILLVVDDIHAADESSMLLLRFLATSAADQRVMIVAAYREADRRIREAGDLFAELSRLGWRLSLTGLTRSDIARYIEIATESAARSAWVERVYDLTAGNPFFVGEVVRAEAEQRSGDDRYRLPEEVRALIRRRVSQLSPEAGRMLHIAATVGREFEFRVLAEMTTLSTERLIDVLGEAELAGIISVDRETPGSYAFAHDLLREAMYEDLSPLRRMELHRTVGRALESVFSSDPDPYLSAIAHHLTQSAPLGDTEAAVAYSTRAGNRAARLLAYEEAAKLYATALQTLSAEEATSEERCRLLLRLGDARARSADTQAAKLAFEAAAAIARRLDDPELLAWVALGYVTSAEPVRLGFGGLLITAMFDEGPTGIGLLEEALAALPDQDGPLRARVLARLATALYPTTRNERRLDFAREAFEMALRLGDPEALVEALHAQHWATLSPDSVQERLANGQQTLLVAMTSGEKEAAFLARHARLHCFLELFDMSGFDVELAAMEQLAERIRQPFYTWHVACLRAIRTLLHGSPIDAERQVRAAYDTGRMRTSEYVTYMFESAQMVCIRWTQGRLGEVRKQIREHGERFSSVPRWRDALLAAEMDDHASARAEIERHARNGFAELPRDGLWLLHLCSLADACVTVEDRDRAEALYELILPYADRNAISISTMPFGPVAMRLGMLARLLERWDDAERHLERALELCRSVGARAIAARVLLEEAKALFARSGEGDRAGALEHLNEAASICEDLKLTGIARRVSDARDHAEPTPATTAPGAVFRREGQFWTIAYGGRTARLRDLRGFRYIADLLGSPGRDFHALDLLTAHTSADAADPTPGEVEVMIGTSSEPVLDARAKQEYRRRLHDLAEELDEARSWHDPERVSQLEAEVEAITDELRRAIGIGGRDRQMLSPAERARVSVTKAIKAAVRTIARECPPLGEHLAASIRTGGFCSYAPPGQQPPRWTL